MMRIDVIQTVLTAPASAALTTLEAVKRECAISSLTDDVYLTEQIDRASELIASHCDRVFGLMQVQSTFRLCGWPMKLRLRQLPVTQIVSITAGGTTLDPAVDYEAVLAEGALYRLTNDIRVAWTASKVIVTYWGGWRLPRDDGRTLPGPVEQACIEVVRARLSGRGRDAGIRSEVTEGVGATTYLDPQRANAVLPETAVLLLEQGFTNIAI